VTPKREEEELPPAHEQGKPHVPKEAIAINPHGEPAMLAFIRDKIEHCGLNYHPFQVAFSGIACAKRLVGGSNFFRFYFAKFRTHAFRTNQ